MAGKLMLPVLCLLGLGGCSSLLTQGAGAGAGIGGAAVANAVTKNGAITAGIGLGAQAAATAGVQYLEKRVHAREQQAIAVAAGPVPVGGVAPWSVRHEIPIENDEHGEVAVVDDFAPSLATGGTPAFDCKNVIFSVDTIVKHRPVREFYTTYVCRDAGIWKWATAEPATARWGALQ
jgi:hypothetical protein